MFFLVLLNMASGPSSIHSRILDLPLEHSLLVALFGITPPYVQLVSTGGNALAFCTIPGKFLLNGKILVHLHTLIGSKRLYNTLNGQHKIFSAHDF